MAADSASRRMSRAKWILVIAFLSLAAVSIGTVLGYQIGKDMALRENARDARVEQNMVRGND